MGAGQGTQAIPHHIRLHNPADGAVVTRDLVFPAMVFTGLEAAQNGQGAEVWKNTGVAEMDASGDAMLVGYVAP